MAGTRFRCGALLTVLVAATAIWTAAPVQTLNNGVGLAPAMGWNSWNTFRCNINDTLIREVADAMVATGLRDAGYVYVNLDDCWMEKRDASGRIVPFQDKFPHGLKPLADYVHSKGLKFGVYSDTGNHTCEGYPGSWGYEKLDATTYAEWGVDYLKYDYCGMEKSQVSVRASYETMRDALNATGRPILYSLCSWGSGQPHLWGKEVGNSWRTGIDLFSVWDSDQARKLKLPNFLQPVTTAIKQQETYADYAGPGGFNDPDMLVVGLEGMYPYGIVQECPEHVPGCKPGMYISRDRWGSVGGLTQTEQRSHFSFWCMLAAPLILGNDPRHMTRATLEILLATEIVALNQDPLGRQARKTWSDTTAEVWVKPLADGRYAVMLFNPGSVARDITLVYSRDIPEATAKWGREVEGSDECKDKDAGCPTWAKAGECEKNAGFMLDRCPHSCPAGCPHAQEPPGPRATAVIRDAWQREDVGAFTGRWTAHLVEPHASRVVTLTFMEPAQALARDAQIRADQAQGAHVPGHLLKQARGDKEAALQLPKAAMGGDATSRLQDSRKLAAGSGKSDGRDALEEEIHVLREELERTNAALQAAQLAARDAQQRAHGAALRQAQLQAAAGGATRVLDCWEGQVLLVLNVVLAMALLLVVRKRGRPVKTGQHTQ